MVVLVSRLLLLWCVIMNNSLIPIWKNPFLSIDDRYEVAIGEIERLNVLIDKASVFRTILRKQIMTYQVDDQAWDREADADRIMARLLSEYDENINK